VPGIVFFAIMLARYQRQAFAIDVTSNKAKRYWFNTALAFGIAAAITGLPMLLKNFVLVGCPLAPEFGCDGTSWGTVYRLHTSELQNISRLDFWLYPFVWTFSTRESMLGNISPLFLGFFPFLFICYRSPELKPALISGLAGLVSIATWLLIEPLVLF